MLLRPTPKLLLVRRDVHNVRMGSTSTTSSLCAPPGSLASLVTRVADGHMLVEKFATVQMAPVDLVQELPRTIAGMLLPIRCQHMAVDAFDTCGWDPGRDPWRAPCHHWDGVEDGLSECETVFACLDYDGDGSNFEVDTDTAFAGEKRVEP